MSLILEALKKSEANRRLGEAPDLGTPFTTTARRRSPLPFVVVAIVIAAGAGWWLLRAPPVAEQATPVQTVADVSAQAKAGPILSKPAAPAVHPAHRPLSATDVHMPIGQTPGATGAATTNTGQAAAPPAAAAPAPAVNRPPVLPAAMAGKPTAGVATPAPGMKKTEAASRQDATVVVAAAPPLPAGAGKVQAQTPVAGNALSSVAAPPGLKKPETMPAPTDEKRNPPPTATPADTGKAAVAKDAAAAPERRAPAPNAGSAPPYNELAFSTRKDLPPIKLSMHVYAADPTQRFVILNDSRMLEGDSQDDLSVREIRPDGVVFEFRGQRFFYPRDGL